VKATRWVIAATLIVAGCGAEQPGNDDGLHSWTEGVRWGPKDDPQLLDSDLVYDVDQLPTEGRVATDPWPGYYWPTAADSINLRWNGPRSESATAKYGRAFGIRDVEKRVSEYLGVLSVSSRRACYSNASCNRSAGEVCAHFNGQGVGRCIPSWWGICDAWAAAAVLEPEPRRAITVNGVTFEIQDLKALISLTMSYADPDVPRPRARRVSLRCNDADSSIKYDAYGRPADSNSECRDTNPGTFHVALANYLGLRQQSLLEDRMLDDEVWTHPMRSYRFRQSEVDAKQANRLVGASGNRYRFNDDAHRLFHVVASVEWVDLVLANAQTNRPLAGSDEAMGGDTYEYVLEVDQADRIIGGEWIGNSKTRHPDFLWLPLGPAQPTVAAGAISYARVKELVVQSANGSSSPLPPDASQDPPTTQHLDQQGSVQRGELDEYTLPVSASHAVVVRTEAPGDVDLFVRLDATPEGRTYDAYSAGWTGNETVTYVPPHAGALHIVVYGYKASTYHLTTSN